MNHTPFNVSGQRLQRRFLDVFRAITTCRQLSCEYPFENMLKARLTNSEITQHLYFYSKGVFPCRYRWALNPKGDLGAIL